MSQIYSWIVASTLFAIGCTLPLVLGRASVDTPKCVCPPRIAPAAPVDFDQVPVTPENPQAENPKPPRFDFILMDAPIREASFRR
jgi:hypothetical protein